MSGMKIKIQNSGTGEGCPNDSDQNEAVIATMPASITPPTTVITEFLDPNSITWHIPRPSLVGHSEKDSDNNTSWDHYHLHLNSSSSSCKSSQTSATSTHSAASGTLLLTAANLANFTAVQQPIDSSPKSMDTASVASSTHFTVINGLGRPTNVNKKSWCASNQLTFLVCTMSALFMIGLLVVILYMEMRVRDRYD